MNIMQLEIVFIIAVFIAMLTVMGYFLVRFLISMYRQIVLRNRLKGILTDHKLKPSKKSCFSDKLLVMDDYNKVVVYLDYFNLNKPILIELEDLKECKLVIRNLIVRLDLIFHNDCKKPVSIVFFHQLLNRRALRCRLTIKARKWNAVFIHSIDSNKEFEYGITG